MKIKFKTGIANTLGLISGLTIIVIGSFVIQGCQDDIIIPNEDLPYLELSSTIESFNTADYEILKQAKERLSEHIRSDKGKFELKINSGAQVNISDELFQYFKNSINNANKKLKEGGYEISGDKIIKEKMIGITRLKSGTTEDPNGVEYVPWSEVNYTWWGMEIYISHSDIERCSDAAFAASFMLGLTSNTGIPVIDELKTVGTYLTFFTGLLINNYDNGRGISIVCPLYVPSYVRSY